MGTVVSLFEINCGIRTLLLMNNLPGKQEPKFLKAPTKRSVCYFSKTFWKLLSLRPFLLWAEDSICIGRFLELLLLWPTVSLLALLFPGLFGKDSGTPCSLVLSTILLPHLASCPHVTIYFPFCPFYALNKDLLFMTTAGHNNNMLVPMANN